MSEQPYYRLELDDYSAASFTSFSKDYFGTMEDIHGFISALEQDEDYSVTQQSLISTFKRYEQGEKKILYHAAHQQVPFLVLAKILCRKIQTYHNLKWEHLNTWQWPYYMRCSQAEAEHIWLKCGKKYYRCIKVRFTNLEYEDLDNLWNPLGDMLWGYPEVIEYQKPLLCNRLAVVEKQFDSLEDLQADIESFEKAPDPEFSRFCDDIFGDG